MLDSVQLGREGPRISRAGLVPQLAISWVLSRGADIVPLLGPRTREQLGDALAALGLELKDDALVQVEEAVPAGAVAGGRYAEVQMAHLDSER